MSGLSLSAWAHTTPHEFHTKSCHSTQREITLLFNYVGPHSASQFPFFNYVRSQRIRRTRWSHKPTQRNKKFFYLNHVSPHNVSRLPFFCCLHRAQQFSSSITWAHTAHHDCFFSVTHPGQNNSSLSNTWAHTAHHDYFFFVTHPLPILLLPTRGKTILFFQTPEPTLRITIYFLSLPTQVITILLFQSREPTQGITIIIFFFCPPSA